MTTGIVIPIFRWKLRGITLGESRVDGMPVYRKDWNELTIKNKPYLYKSDATDKNKLYDLILDNEPNTTFFR